MTTDILDLTKATVPVGADAIYLATGIVGKTGTDQYILLTDLFDNMESKINRNSLINGGMRTGQRGTTFDATTSPLNSDDTYLLDRWILLSDGNDVVDVSQSTEAPDGALNSIKLEVETANKQFGILQILENKDAMSFAGKKASLSFQARMAAADDNTHSLKAIVLSWDGVADTVTSDVVNAWLATPTYVANWTGENTPVSNTLTTSWQTFEIEDIDIDTASMANLAVFFFCDQTDGAIGDAIYITKTKIERGSVATDFVSRPYAEELALCQRYYEKAYEVGTAPGTVLAAAFAIYAFTYGTYPTAVCWFKVQKRTSPTVVAYDLAGTVGKVTIDSGDDVAATIAVKNTVMAAIYPTGAQTAANHDMNLFFTADAEL